MSKNLAYFVSNDGNCRLYKFNLKNRSFQIFHHEKFYKCVNINYCEAINRAYVTTNRNGIYSFELGKEETIKKETLFEINFDMDNQAGFLFLKK